MKLLLDDTWSPSIPEALTGPLTGRDGQQQESGAERVHGGAQSLSQARARLFNPRRGMGRFACCHVVLTPMGDSGLCSRGASLCCRRSEHWCGLHVCSPWGPNSGQGVRRQVLRSAQCGDGVWAVTPLFPQTVSSVWMPLQGPSPWGSCPRAVGVENWPDGAPPASRAEV